MKASGGDSIPTGPEITIPDTVTVNDWYVVIKTGCMNAVGSGPTFDFLFDNLSLIDLNANNIIQKNLINNINIFPNPTNGIINITLSDNSNITKYNIYNVAGVLVKTGNIDNNQLDITSLNKGIYVIKLDNNSSTEFHKLVLK